MTASRSSRIIRLSWVYLYRTDPVVVPRVTHWQAVNGERLALLPESANLDLPRCVWMRQCSQEGSILSTSILGIRFDSIRFFNCEIQFEIGSAFAYISKLIVYFNETPSRCMVTQHRPMSGQNGASAGQHGQDSL